MVAPGQAGGVYARAAGQQGRSCAQAASSRRRFIDIRVSATAGPTSWSLALTSIKSAADGCSRYRGAVRRPDANHLRVGAADGCAGRAGCTASRSTPPPSSTWALMLAVKAAESPWSSMSAICLGRMRYCLFMPLRGATPTPWARKVDLADLLLDVRDRLGLYELHAYLFGSRLHKT